MLSSLAVKSRSLQIGSSSGCIYTSRIEHNVFGVPTLLLFASYVNDFVIHIQVGSSQSQSLTDPETGQDEKPGKLLPFFNLNTPDQRCKLFRFQVFILDLFPVCGILERFELAEIGNVCNIIVFISPVKQGNEPYSAFIQCAESLPCLQEPFFDIIRCQVLNEDVSP